MKVKVKEIFTSIQGEGPFVGYKQLFVRFCRCNLRCEYCDTDFAGDSSAKEYTPAELAEFCNNYNDCHSISLTGGEPLLETEFLKEFLPLVKLPIYLETNGILYNELAEIIRYVDYISADIKLSSVTKQESKWEEHDRFLAKAKQKMVFAKIVFDSSVTEEEIQKSSALCKKYDAELILQPMMNGNKPVIGSDFMIKTLDKFLVYYSKVRLIPQVHKFIKVE